MTLARLGCITPSQRKPHKIASFLVEYQLDLYITASLKNRCARAPKCLLAHCQTSLTNYKVACYMAPYRTGALEILLAPEERLAKLEKKF
jgi:hypothetical protein